MKYLREPSHEVKTDNQDAIEMAQNLKLIGKNVIITGASRGIGFAIARLFAIHGVARMVLVGRSNTLAQASEAISKGTSTRTEFSIGNVKDRRFWETLRHDMVSCRASIAKTSELC